MCGKNLVNLLLVLKVLGSPPRVREKLDVMKDIAAQVRITPACAGKTDKVKFTIQCKKDHPRVCGKNEVRAVKFSYVVGSPPRVREKLRPDGQIFFIEGITPACAGKTSFKRPMNVLDRDHPRVCGKNFLTKWLSTATVGSPPRVREKPVYLEQDQKYLRITPACAGKTSLPVIRYNIARDHPRVCGKNGNNSVVA